jgi:hypothetical protein
MPASPAPADPGRDDDLAWLDRDPMTAAERQASLDRLCEQDEGHREDEADQYGDVEPLTPEELAEIREAAADELLAVEAATTGRRGPGQPGSARVFPGESSSAAAGFGPGMPLDILPGCAAWRSPPTPPPGRTAGSPGCRRLSWPGCCARGTGSRPTPPPASSPWPRSWPAAALPLRTASSPRIRSRTRWASPAAGPGNLIDLAQTLRDRLPGTAAALDDGIITRYKAEIITRATPSGRTYTTEPTRYPI